MKFRTILNIAILLIVIEAFIALKLLSSNRKYEKQNRSLIVENDSILSVNMQLSRKLIDSTERLSIQLQQ